MVRESKRTVILEAAVRVIESDGITAVAFDSIAAATDITRGGIIYHFPSRDDLIGAIHQHLANRWEQQLEMTCGKPADQATLNERLIAYIRSAAVPATRAELQMILDSHHTEHQKIWDAVLNRWTGRNHQREAAVDQTTQLALLATNGLWVDEVLDSQPIPSSQRAHAAEQIINLLTTNISGSDLSPHRESNET